MTMTAPPLEPRRLSRSPAKGRAQAVFFHTVMIAAVAKALWQDWLFGFLVLVVALTIGLPLAAGQFSYHRGLVNDVRDHGDRLRFRSGDVEQEVLLRDIAAIEVDTSFSARVVITTQCAGPLGTRLTFLPRSILSVDMLRMVEGLRARVDEAKRAVANSD